MSRMRGSHDYDGVTQTDNEWMAKALGLFSVSRYGQANTSHCYTSNSRKQNRDLLGKCSKIFVPQDLGIKGRGNLRRNEQPRFDHIHHRTNRLVNLFCGNGWDFDTWGIKQVSRQLVECLCSQSGFSGNEFPVSRKAVMSWI